MVLCVDEKPAVQALERTQPVLPLVMGQSSRATATYKQHGVTNLFAALNVATGTDTVASRPSARHERRGREGSILQWKPTATSARAGRGVGGGVRSSRRVLTLGFARMKLALFKRSEVWRERARTWLFELAQRSIASSEQAEDEVLLALSWVMHDHRTASYL